MLREKVQVKKSRSAGIFKDTWYVLAYGKCFRYPTWITALWFAIANASRHAKWVAVHQSKETTTNARQRVPTQTS